MCVIIIKKAGIEMPSEEILYSAYMANKDGMGFVSDSDHMRTVRFSRFMDRIKNVKKEENCIIHFRYATCGSVRTRNCHPFRGNNIYFFHNGVIPIRVKSDMTDSETAFREVFLPAIKKYGLFSEQATRVIESLRGTSRFVFYQGGKYRMFGMFENVHGVLYSNTRFMAPRRFATLY